MDVLLVQDGTVSSIGYLDSGCHPQASSVLVYKCHSSLPLPIRLMLTITWTSMIRNVLDEPSDVMSSSINRCPSGYEISLVE